MLARLRSGLGRGRKDETQGHAMTKCYSKIVMETENDKLEFVEETYSRIKTSLQLEELKREDKIFIGISGCTSLEKDFVSNLLPIALKSSSPEKDDVIKMIIDIRSNIKKQISAHGGSQQIVIPKPGVDNNIPGVYMWPVFFEKLIPGKRFGILLFNDHSANRTGYESKLSKFQKQCCHVVIRAELRAIHDRNGKLQDHNIIVKFSDVDGTRHDEVTLIRFGECYDFLSRNTSFHSDILVGYAKSLASTTVRFYRSNLKSIENTASLSGYFKECLEIVNCTPHQNQKRPSINEEMENSGTRRQSQSSSSGTSRTAKLDPASVWPEIEHKIIEWIQLELQEESLHELENVLDKVLCELKTLPKWSQNRCLESYEPELRSKIQKSEEWLRKYCKSLHDLQHSKDLGQIECSLDNLRDKLLASVKDQQIAILIDQGIQILSEQFLSFLHSVQRDRLVQQQMLKEFLQLYEEIIETTFKKVDAYCPSYIYTISRALKETITRQLQAFVDGRWNFEADMRKLEHDLGLTLRRIHSDQLIKLETKWKNLKGAITKAKSTYDNEIEEFLSSCPNADEVAFNREHKKIFSSCKQLLADAIQRDIYHDEPIGEHISSLIAKINLSHGVLHDVENPVRTLPVNANAIAGNPADNIQSEDVPQKKCLASSKSVGMPKERLLRPTAPRSKSPAREVSLEYEVLFQLSFSGVKSAYAPVDLTPKMFSGRHIKGLGNKVGLAINNDREKWVIIEAEYIPDEFIKKVWSIKDILIGLQYEEHVMYNEANFMVTPDFLLAVMFAAEKYRIEQEVRKPVCKALITVPVWFTSYQRQQVFNALSIAHFDKIAIINESSAEAFYYIQQYKESAIVTLSENSDRINVCLFLFDSSSYIQTMLSCTDYGEVDNESDKVRLLSHGKKAREEAAQKMANFYNLACDRTEMNWDACNLDSFPLAYSEDLPEKWKHFGKTFKQRLHELDEAAINGLAEISKKMGIENCIKFKEVSAFNIVCSESVPGGGEVTIREITSIEEPNNPPFSCKLRMRIGELQFYQSNSTMKVQFGSLTINQCPKDSQDIIIQFKYNEHGIIKLHNVEYSISLQLENQAIKILPPECYKWNDFDLPAKQIETYRKVISELFTNDKSSKNQKTFEAFVKSLNNIQNAIKNGDGYFGGIVVKEAVLKRINDLLELSKSESTKLDAHEVEEFLNKIVTKHKLEEFMASVET